MQTETKLFAWCWWVLFSLQQCVWSYGLLSSLLPMSDCTSLTHWRYYTTGYQKRKNWMGWDGTELCTTERHHCNWYMAVRVAESTKQALVSQNLYGENFHTVVHRVSTFGINKDEKKVRLCSVRQRCFPQVESYSAYLFHCPKTL